MLQGDPDCRSGLEIDRENGVHSPTVLLGNGLDAFGRQKLQVPCPRQEQGLCQE